MLIIMLTSVFLFHLSVSISLQIVFSLFTGWQHRPLQCQLDDRCRPTCNIQVKLKNHYCHHNKTLSNVHIRLPTGHTTLLQR